VTRVGFLILLGSLMAPAVAHAAPAADFGVGAAACAKLLAAQQYDEKSLEADGWTKSQERGGIRVYSRDGAAVKLFLSSMTGANGCIVDGYADKDEKVEALTAAITASLKPIAGSDLKVPAATVPGGQGFAFGPVIQILSTEKRPAGLSVRITGMRMDDPAVQ
jgi:hypothetical protein